MSDIEQYQENIFESIRQVTEEGTEFWSARDLMIALQYTKWENFSKVIEKAKKACENSQKTVSNHFPDVRKMVEIGYGVYRTIEDIALTRYACYLIVQNGDSRKTVIAQGQTYFAEKTRQQELLEDYEQMSEDKRRIKIRQQMREHNKSLAEAAACAGVIEPRDFGVFQNQGYKGLYGGLDKNAIHERKGLKKSQEILDHMGSTELAANLFRATQTEEKLRRDNIQGKKEANDTHYNVGKKVRETIRELGGRMPEDLPTPEKSIKQLEKEQKKLLKNDSNTEVDSEEKLF